LIEGARNGAGNAGAHEHVIDARQHRAIERGKGGYLDFFEQVDADEAGVVFLGEENFDKVGGDGEFDQCLAAGQGGHGGEFERRTRSETLG
jgi:hypothetical protein